MAGKKPFVYVAGEDQPSIDSAIKYLRAQDLQAYSMAGSTCRVGSDKTDRKTCFADMLTEWMVLSVSRFLVVEHDKAKGMWNSSSFPPGTVHGDFPRYASAFGLARVQVVLDKSCAMTSSRQQGRISTENWLCATPEGCWVAKWPKHNFVGTCPRCAKEMGGWSPVSCGQW